MQLQLPIFPKETLMVSDQSGVFTNDGLVQYIINGLPAYSHAISDRNSFRFITRNFIHMGLCRKVDIQRSFNVSDDSVSRAYKRFVKGGADAFFGSDARKGKAYKITGELLERIQSKLDKGEAIIV